MAIAGVLRKRKRTTKPRRESFDREMELTEHLAELRARIFRALLYVAIGTAVAWVYYPAIYVLLTKPVLSLRNGVQWDWIFVNFIEPFMVRLQVSAVAGIILVFPLLTMEAWGFVSPALTRTERRAVCLVAPLCVVLFLAGVALTLVVLPSGLRWFLGFLPPDTRLMQKVTDYVLFLVRMCLAFGIMFQLPVVMLFLAKVGLVNSRFLARYWRQAIVLSAAAAALITPSADAFTMLAATAPLTVLYGLSIILVKFVERGERSSPRASGESGGGSGERSEGRRRADEG
ncbi:MAG: twin-arginine translocase subunit TatC [Armatimonadetes bacterium]|nr:twin-arginine translocase subunit TatC [Armatimonadota bacterium]